ncbi:MULTISPECIES: glycosyltransferase [Tenacibaculum]|uniref:glycosyltransferase n=1 Tax=Tenacibaculum TaxID=104267 RepID=UPI001F0A893F|nr:MULTISPECIES: glycosyltransferase [Tenacibaculum]MCH3881954.1 glycosyltransferase [Tenacibaculum aquimarinum]MDO6600707.1 glycosyltransferase [Tenacibaculum sp. 1_MG-2023]
MIKAIQLIDSLDTGGAEVLAVNIANLLAKENIDSHLCVTRKEGLLKEKVSKNVNYIFLNRKSTFDVKAILKLKNYIKKNNISIIHSHATSSFIAFCVKIIYPKVKIVWHDHYGNSEFLEYRKTVPLSLFSRFFQVIISVNLKLKEWAEQNLFAKENLMLNNFAFFNTEEKLTKLKGEEGRRIVHVAGFRAQKDHITLLKAFKIVQERNPLWTLHLVGEIYDDSYSKSIQNFIKDNNLTDSIFMYDAKSDIKNILVQATIGVLSSKSEGLPVALLEYGLAKLPVLVTDVGECNKVITNSESLVAPKNHLLFSEKLNKLIIDKLLREKISYALHLKVREEFSKESFTTELIHIYKNLC